MSFLEMSFAGAIMILVIAALRALSLNRLPKGTFIFLWEIAMLRLVLPVSVPSITSIYTLFCQSKSAQSDYAGVAVRDVPTITYFLTADSHQAAVPQPEPAPAGSIPVWTVLWFIGALVTLCIFALGYLSVFRKYRFATQIRSGYPADWLSEQKLRRRVRICTSVNARSPLTYGILRPVILLPETIETHCCQALTCILTHELTHIRRFDMIRKLAAAAVLCIHWFNPLVWVLFLLYNRDIELACDEAAVRTMNGDCRAAYAMALIAMEEKQSSFSSLFNHFSKNAIEERIIAIMKMKKITLTAVFAACTLVTCVTCTFATTAATQKVDTEPEYTVTDTIMLTDGETGETFYSTDNGRTFSKLEDLDICTPDIEWWTYDEYKAWLDEEKTALQSMLGERAWTGGEGWFTWTQEKIDETIALYEDMLEQIKNGAQISKSVDGNPDIMLMQGVPITSSAETGELTCDTKEEVLETFASFGISFDAENRMLYQGEFVRYFCDGCEIESGNWAIRSSFYDKRGSIDVYAVYEPTQNSDGSVDPFGRLVGLRKATQKEFDAMQFGFTAYQEATSAIDDTLIQDPTTSHMASTYAIETSDIESFNLLTGTSFETVFSKYKKFGIEYQAVPNALGNVYYKGELVKHFLDYSPNKSAFSFDSTDGGTINVAVVYDENKNPGGIKIVP